MKHLAFLLFVIIIIVSGCKKEPDPLPPAKKLPYASFSGHQEGIKGKATVTFTNKSKDATQFIYYFGDGYEYSTYSKDPIYHVYYNNTFNDTTYYATLKAINDSHDTATSLPWPVMLMGY